MKVLCCLKQSMLVVYGALCLMFVSEPSICSANSPPQGQKYALLIGIDDYTPSNFPSLKGAVNDMRMVRDLLVQRFGFKAENVVMLADRDATHTGIIAAMQGLADKVKSGDAVYIHYSGHGSGMRDENGDESGRRGIDSTWVSYGSRSSVEAPASKTAKSTAGKKKGKTTASRSKRCWTSSIFSMTRLTSG